MYRPLYCLLLLKTQKLNCQIINHADFVQKRPKNFVTRNYQCLRYIIYKPPIMLIIIIMELIAIGGCGYC